MAKIDVDFEVFKALTALRETEQMTENDVLRGLLGLEDKSNQLSDMEEIDKVVQQLLGSWSVKDVTFPVGTQFRAQYKGSLHFGVVEDGALVVDGVSCKSPSGAAKQITNTQVDGWKFWECKFPNEEHWKSISSLRGK